LKDAGVYPGNFSGKIQLMGISHGARVAALAAEDLYKGKGGSPGSSLVVNQLTLGDSPEGVTALSGPIPLLKGANNSLGPVLNGIKIGRTPDTTFVDNYYSCFGGPYAYNKDPVTPGTSIVNVQLYPKSSDWGDKHVYPVPWYTGATNNTTTLGLAWSPLVGSMYGSLWPYYEQDWASDEYALKATPIVIAGSTNDSNPVTLTTLLTESAVTDIPNGKNLTEHSPAYWHSSFAKKDNDIMLEFTYQFVNPGDGDQLTLWIDDELRFVITGNMVGTDAYTTDIDITDLASCDHILSVALNNYGDSDASVNVTDFTMVSVPEPSTLVLLGIGAIGLLTNAWRLRKRA
jgi:hypothetical protein